MNDLTLYGQHHFLNVMIVPHHVPEGLHAPAMLSAYGRAAKRDLVTSEALVQPLSENIMEPCPDGNAAVAALPGKLWL